MNEVDQPSLSLHNHSPMRRAYALLAVPLLIVCFFEIDQTWDASLYSEAMMGLYDGSENRTADRLESVNVGSSSCRLVLAGFGVLGLLIPAAVRFDFECKAFWGLCAYFGWMFASVFWTSDPNATVYKLMVVGVFLIAAFGLAHQLTMYQLMHYFSLTCAAFVIIGVVAEIAHGRFHIFRGDYRFTGTTHPNTEAVFGSIICFCSVFTIRKKNGRLSLLGFSYFMLGLMTLFLSKSRTSLAAMMLGLTVIGACHVRPQLRVPLVAGVLSGLAMVILLFSLVGSQFQGKVGSAAAMGRGDDVSTLTGRLPLWEELLDAISERPIVGHGYMAFWTTEEVEYLSDLLKWEIPHGHNIYLDIMLDGGIVALLLFIAMLLAAEVTALRRFFQTRDDSYSFLAGLILFTFIHGFGESIMKLMVFTTFVVFTLVCRLVWVPKLSRKNAREHHRDQPTVEGAVA